MNDTLVVHELLTSKIGSLKRTIREIPRRETKVGIQSFHKQINMMNVNGMTSEMGSIFSISPRQL